MGACECDEPIRERGGNAAVYARSSQRVRRDRLHDRERVANPMVEFIHHDTLVLGGVLAFGDVASDADAIERVPVSSFTVDASSSTHATVPSLRMTRFSNE